MKVDLYNISGSKTSKKADLNDKVFKIKPNQHSIYLAIKSELASRRQGTSSSKTRSEVRGGGAKPWKQKGTGRARIGSTRNPSRVHGGTAFGPEPRDYNMKVNKKVRKIARISAFSDKCASGNIIVMDSFELSDIKTKNIKNTLKELKINDKKVSFLSKEKDSNFYLSCRNLKDVNTYKVDDVSVYELMNSNMLVLDKNSVEYLNSLGKD